jgi:hypothetical protein
MFCTSTKTDAERLLTEREAAELLNLSLKKLQADRYARQGVNYVKMGRSIRYRIGDLQSYIDQCCVRHDV